jgi:hypothetical protein
MLYLVSEAKDPRDFYFGQAGGGLIFASRLHILIHSHSNIMSILQACWSLAKGNKGKQHCELSPLSLPQPLVRRVVAQTELAQLHHDFLMMSCLAHTVCSGQSITDSQIDQLFSRESTFGLIDWLYKSDEIKLIKTLWKRSYYLHSFLAAQDLDLARLRTASLPSTPYILWRN